MKFKEILLAVVNITFGAEFKSHGKAGLSRTFLPELDFHDMKVILESAC